MIPVDHAGARAALADITARTTDLVAGIEDQDVPVRGLEWTLGQTAMHVLVTLRGFTEAVRGEADGLSALVPRSPGYRERMAGMTARTIAAEPRRDVGTLSRLIGEAATAFLAASSGGFERDLVPTPWYGERATLPLGAATCLLLGEQVVHGFDMARTMGRPWRLDAEQARLVLPAPLTMMPIVLDPTAARDVRAVYALHVRGGLRACLSIRDGAASVAPLGPTSPRIDCHLAADPVAFMMVGYGRLGLASAILRGKMMAYGRKPWLGFRLRQLFFDP